MRSLLGIVNWVVGYSLSLFQVCSAITFWPEEYLLKDQLLSLWESPCVLFVVSPLMLLIFILCIWSLLIWLICDLGCFTLGLSCLGLFGFLEVGWLFPSPFWGSFPLLSPWVFSQGLSFWLLLLELLWSNVGAFHIVPEVPEVVLISFDSLFFFPLCFIYFHHFIFYLTYPIFCLLFYSWFPP